LFGPRFRRFVLRFSEPSFQRDKSEFRVLVSFPILLRRRKSSINFSPRFRSPKWMACSRVASKLRLSKRTTAMSNHKWLLNSAHAHSRRDESRSQRTAQVSFLSSCSYFQCMIVEPFLQKSFCLFVCLLQVPLISCASTWRAGETKNDARPKLENRPFWSHCFVCVRL
jgi:hypothetical protein